MGRAQSQNQQRGRDHDLAAEHHPVGAVAHHELSGEADGEPAHHHSHGQEGEADGQRPVPEHPFQVERAEKEEAEKSGREQRLHGVRARDGAGSEDPQRDHGRPGGRLPCYEGPEERQRDHAHHW